MDYLNCFSKSFNENLTQTSLYRGLQDEALLKRVAFAALPVITMYQPVSKIVNVSLHLYQLHLNLSNGISKQTLVHTALLTANIAASYLYPEFSALATITSELIYNLHELTGHIKEANVKLAALKILHIMHNLINIGLLFHVTPERLLISLLIQAVKELHIAYHEYKSEHYLETAANVLYAGIRLKAASPHYREVHRNFYGKEITQKEVDDLVKLLEVQKNLKPTVRDNCEEGASSEIYDPIQKVIEVPNTRVEFTNSCEEGLSLNFEAVDKIIPVLEAPATEEKVSLDTLLKKKNFKNIIRNINLDGNKISNVSFENLKVIDSTFRNMEIEYSNFQTMTIENSNIFKVRVTGCLFGHSNFVKTNIVNCDFVNTTLYDSNLTQNMILMSRFTTFRVYNSNFFKTSFAYSYFMENKIEGAHFRENNFIRSGLESVVLERSLFERTIFKKTIMKFNRFKRVQFSHCDLKSARLLDNDFDEIIFDCSDLKKATFNWSKLSKTFFHDSDLTAACFNDAILADVSIISSRLSESTFFLTKVSNSRIIDSNLINTLLFETASQFLIEGGTANIITKPVIGLLYDFELEPPLTRIIYKCARKTESIVFRFQSRPRGMDMEALRGEISVKIQEESLQPRVMPLPQFIIKNNHSNAEITKVKEYAKKVMQNVDGLIIGGGESLDPRFYGHKANSSVEQTPLRSILEFSLMEGAENTNVPTLAVCRGVQSLNVFHGGTLHQNVEKHFCMVHNLKLTEDVLQTKPGQIARDILNGTEIAVYSMHFQACNEIGNGLHVAIRDYGTPELLISELKPGVDYPLFIGTQFHPEASHMKTFVDTHKNNHNFFEDLQKRASKKLNTAWINRLHFL